jgi:hypothetical protein
MHRGGTRSERRSQKDGGRQYPYEPQEPHGRGDPQEAARTRFQDRWVSQCMHNPDYVRCQPPFSGGRSSLTLNTSVAQGRLGIRIQGTERRTLRRLEVPRFSIGAGDVGRGPRPMCRTPWRSVSRTPRKWRLRLLGNLPPGGRGTGLLSQNRERCPIRSSRDNAKKREAGVWPQASVSHPWNPCPPPKVPLRRARVSSNCNSPHAGRWGNVFK